MDPALEPWLFHGVQEMQRRIAALELMSCLFLLRMVQDWMPRKATSVRLKLRAVNDNKGNMHALMKSYSSTFPTAAVHMELVTAARADGSWIAMDHVKRELNQDADDLTNKIFDKFNPRLRWRPDRRGDFYKVMHDLHKAHLAGSSAEGSSARSPQRQNAAATLRHL